MAESEEMVSTPNIEEDDKPKLDSLGRAYSTGKRKDAVARVWIKKGSGQISINKNSGLLRKIEFKQFLILILLVFCSLIQFGYGADILTQNFGCYTLPNIKNFFLEKGFFEPISIFLAYLFTPIIHLIL